MLAIIDYDTGNLRSVQKAFQFVGADACITSDQETIAQADAIVLPGVGAFGEGMKSLHQRNLVHLLKDEIQNKKKPFLGICLGMQLLGKKSYEHGVHEGLGILDFEVKSFSEIASGFRIPHMGWNNVDLKPSPLFSQIQTQSDYYFVHSYFVVPTSSDIEIATCEYGGTFCAAVAKENVFGTQFHPEKSQKNGISILRNFLNLC